MIKLKYTSYNKNLFEAHMMVFGLIEQKKTVLDIGCATGYFAKELKKKNCMTYGVEIDKIAAKRAMNFCEKVFVVDIKKISKLNAPREFFDYILFLDVLEHLENPLQALNDAKKFLKKDGKFILSVPNIAHISVRTRLFLGRFHYSNSGILDRDHLRFFTKKTFIELITSADLKILQLDYPADFGQIPVFGRFLKKLNKKWQYLITKLLNPLLAGQFIAVCIF
ncbi:class I SAM-dependent methyltransferase [Candidatus Microgenomates bacterium]|nr:class I SAM-dependent methyltransferase [Candidatus Microgenomates bacterium]